MTRWARAGNSQKHKKMPQDSTSWEELSKGIKNSTKCKEKQKHPESDKVLEIVRNDKKGFNDSKNFCKEELCDKSLKRNQILEEESFVVNVTDNYSSCEIDKSTEECAKGEKTMSKRQLKKLKREEKKLKTACNPKLENTSDPTNICENASATDSTQDCNETLRMETSVPKSTRALSKKQLKRLERDKSNPTHISEDNKKKDNSSPVEKRLKRKEEFMRKLQERRAQNGITLLSPAAENRLYRIKKRLRQKGYTPEMIKDIIRKERRKAELEFRKTLFTKTCYTCGQPGHLRADCHLSTNTASQKILTCRKCGSTEHNSIECSETDYGHSFLTCFICKDQGHISKDCPAKKRGAVKEEVEPLVALHTINEGKSIDDEIIDIKKTTEKSKSIKPKVVVF